MAQHQHRYRSSPDQVFLVSKASLVHHSESRRLLLLARLIITWMTSWAYSEAGVEVEALLQQPLVDLMTL